MEIKEDQIKIINSYKESFIEEYQKWKDIISEINKCIPIYKEELQIDIDINKIVFFSYDEFCNEFLKQLNSFFEDFDILTKIGLHTIFESMILLKIANASDEPSSLIEKFLL